MSDIAVAPTGLREPAHLVSPRAVPYWRTGAVISAVVVTAPIVTGYVLTRPWPWWAAVLAAVAVGALIARVFVMPSLRYRVHRWEINDIAVHTQDGWLSRNQRIAPLSRVQTVDTREGALMRLFGLSTLTVTTASAAGAVTIDCLDKAEAARLVEELTAITGASEGDAT